MISPIRKSSRRWATPCANEGAWSLEAISETVHGDGSPASDPHKRLYHPETGQIVQRTLDTYVKGAEAGLWLTPTAAPYSGGGRGGELHKQVAENDSEQLLPTPRASDGARGRAGARGANGRQGGGTLRDAVDAVRWPTPKASPSGPDYARSTRDESGGDDLATAVNRDRLLPTPSASDGQGGRLDPPETRATEKRPSGAKAQRTLRGVATDSEDVAVAGTNDGSTGLNPTWVEWLMGFPCGWTDVAVAPRSGRRKKVAA